MSSTIILNGKVVPAEEACIKFNDRGFTLGHGLFETILANKNTFPAFHYHWDRLATSAALLGIALPFSKHRLQEMLFRLVSQNNFQQVQAAVRFTLTDGESARGILPLTPPIPNYVISINKFSHILYSDFSCFMVSTRKNEHALTSRIKSISYLDNILARKEARSQGYDEAIFLNTSNHIADGAITNLFLIKDAKIYTPKVTDGALPGVIRTILIKESIIDLPIIECSISVDELLEADEVFVTNALMGIQPVKRINAKLYEERISQSIRQTFISRKNYI